jgi:hypothetical protein
MNCVRSGKNSRGEDRLEGLASLRFKHRKNGFLSREKQTTCSY